jgi:hypothetical protein
VVGVAVAGFDRTGVAIFVGVELPAGMIVDSKEGGGAELVDAGDGVGVADVEVSAPALFTVTLVSASF